MALVDHRCVCWLWQYGAFLSQPPFFWPGELDVDSDAGPEDEIDVLFNSKPKSKKKSKGKNKDKQEPEVRG